MSEKQPTIGAAYPAGQLANAFVTAATHEDAGTRHRADERIRRWSAVLAGIATGRLMPGSRTPVRGLPAWVTLDVLRGGFATGSAAAGGPLRPHERSLATRHGVPAERGALFAWYMSDAGLAELWSLLDGGGYRLELPEQAALLAVAWLVRAGDRARALGLLEEIGPFAGRLCFAPAPAPVPAAGADPAVVWRESSGEVGDALARRQENARVEAMREALTVWNPFADQILSLWLETRDGQGRVAASFPAGWRERAAELIALYYRLAATHTRCGKHRRRKENLAILRVTMEQTAAGQPLTPRMRGLLTTAVDAMLARRGRPGSPEHSVLRQAQERNASVPGHHRMARVVVARLGAFDPDAGVRDVESLCAPVSEDESAVHAIPVGAPIPESIRRVVRRAAAGTVPELIEAGVVPSAEVLAELVPQLAAVTSGAAYPDPALRLLMAATYRAFRRRRSLLLVGLQHQVRLTELPWVRAVGPYRESSAGTRRDAAETLRRLGELTLDGFPATLLPNALVRELSALGRESGEDLPWVEELAADIFMGRFSVKYLGAAHLAGQLLSHSLYARYYDIDYQALPVLPVPGAAGRSRQRDESRGLRWHAGRDKNTADKAVAASVEAFGALCRDRAPGHQASGHGWSWVAGNGMVIEQAQILTTHNLATLVHAVGVAPSGGWTALARRAFTTVVRLTGRLERNPRPLPTIKDIAYAWRHLVFYLSLAGSSDPRTVIDQLHAELAEAPGAIRNRLKPALTGLGYVATGGRFTGDHTPAGGRRLLGWTTERHWLDHRSRGR